MSNEKKKNMNNFAHHRFMMAGMGPIPILNTSDTTVLSDNRGHRRALIPIAITITCKGRE